MIAIRTAPGAEARRTQVRTHALDDEVVGSLSVAPALGKIGLAYGISRLRTFFGKGSGYDGVLLLIRFLPR